MESKEIIEKLFFVLICLSMHPFVLEEPISALSQACHYLCEISITWRIEVVEGLVFSVLMKFRERMSFVSMFILIEISISRPISCVIMNICVHGCKHFIYMFKLNMLD